MKYLTLILLYYLCSSLQEESAESVCGAQLTDVNQKICQILPLLTGAFASLNEYINIIVEGTGTIYCIADHEIGEKLNLVI